MLILEVLMGLNSKQGDINSAFIHAGIPDDKKVYIEMPIGFETFSNNGHKKCLKRKKNVLWYPLYSTYLLEAHEK